MFGLLYKFQRRGSVRRCFLVLLYHKLCYLPQRRRPPPLRYHTILVESPPSSTSIRSSAPPPSSKEPRHLKPPFSRSNIYESGGSRLRNRKNADCIKGRIIALPRLSKAGLASANNCRSVGQRWCAPSLHKKEKTPQRIIAQCPSFLPRLATLTKAATACPASAKRRLHLGKPFFNLRVRSYFSFERWRLRRLWASTSQKRKFPRANNPPNICWLQVRNAK